ncbi:MAG: tetratricopeptide repeat protein, partial [Blastocatellia bacterium]
MIRLYPTLTILLLPAVCLSVASPSRAITQSTSPGMLTPGKPVEGRLAAGEKHRFTVQLNDGQTCRVTMAAGENVIMTVMSAEGSELGESDLDQEAAGQSVLILAGQSGDYRVQIKTDDEGKPGSYKIEVDEARESSDRDRQVAQAQNNFLAANRLSSEGTKESSEVAIKKYEAAAALWKAAEDKGGEAQSLFQAGNVRFNLGNSKEALKNLLAALPLSISAGRLRLERMLLDKIGNTYARLSDYEKALDYLNQSLTASRSAGDKGQEGEALNSIGLVYASQGRYQKALESYSQALPLLRA